MDDQLNNTPALIFVKDLSTWLVINSKSEPTMWLDDAEELAWFFASILELGAKDWKKLAAKNASTNCVLGQNAQRRNAAA